MNEHEQPTPEPTAPPDQPGHEGGGQPGRRTPDPVAPGEIGPRGSRRLLASRATGWAVAGVLACAVVGLSVALASTSSTPVARISIGATVPGRFGPVLPGRFNAGIAPFGGRLSYGERGAVGTVDHVSATRFTMTTRAGEKLTVDERSSTVYRKGASSASASAVKHGATVLVFGSSRGSTIQAAQVDVLPAGGAPFGPPAAVPAT
jgi:hypothetical protein